MKIKYSQRGFSLIELLVAVAIASIIIATAGRFLSSVLRLYRADSREIRLQMEIEDIMDVLERELSEGTAPEISDDGKTIKIIKTDGDSVRTQTVFLNENNLYYTNEAGEGVYIGTNVSDISFSVSLRNKAIIVSLLMENDGLNYRAERKILLRNELSDGEAVYASKSWADMEIYDSDAQGMDIDVQVYSVNKTDSQVTYGMSLTNKGRTLQKNEIKYRFYYYYEVADSNPRPDITWSASADGRSVSVVNHYVATYTENVSYANAGTDYINWVRRNSIRRVTTYVGYAEISGADVLALKEELKENDSMYVSLKAALPSGVSDSKYHFLMNHKPLSGFDSISGTCEAAPRVVVYYTGVRDSIWGSVPALVKPPSFAVTSNTLTQVSDTRLDASITICRTGMNIDWSNVSLYYYWIDNMDSFTLNNGVREYDKQIEVSNLSVVSTNGAGPQNASIRIVRPQDNAEKYDGTNGYLEISFEDAQKSQQTEYVTVSFTLTCADNAFFNRTLAQWYSGPKTQNSAAVNNLHVYGLYSGSNACSFGQKPSGAYKEVKKAETVTMSGGAYVASGSVEKIVVTFMVNSGLFSSVVAYKNSNMIDGCIGAVTPTATEMVAGNIIEKTLVISTASGEVDRFYLKTNNATIMGVAVIYK